MGLALEESNEIDGVKSYQINGVDILIADSVKPFADRNKIDYVDSPGRKGFVVMSSGNGQC